VSVVANVAINVDSRGAVGKLREVQNRTSALDKATQGLTRSLAGLAAGFGATFALGKIISDVAKLDTNLRRLGTVGGDVQGLSKALDQVGKNVDGIAGKAELAAASYQALSAGFTDTAQNAKVVEAATKAAVGGLVDVTAATEVTTKVLNAYNMNGDQATKVTDSIAKSIEYGVVQWSDYTSQLGRVASISAVAGVSLDEINAFIAAATKNSATAEIAFTGLGATLSNMLKPTKESAEAAAALGINWNLAGIRGEGFESLMGKLGVAMKENPVLANQMVGGQEAVRGAFAAASKGGKDYTTILEGLGGAAGKTQSDFDTMKDSVENQIKALNTAFTELGTKLFEVFGPTLTDLIKGTTKALTDAVNAFNALPEPVKKNAAELVRLIAQMLLVKKALEGIIALRTAFVAAMIAKAGAIASTGTAAKTSASMFALYTANTKTLKAQAAAATPLVNGLRIALSRLAAIGIITVGIQYVISYINAGNQASTNLKNINERLAKGGTGGLIASGGKAQSREVVETAIKNAKAEKAKIEARLEKLQPAAQMSLLGGNAKGAPESIQRKALQAQLKDINTILKLNPSKFKTQAELLRQRSNDIIDPNGDGGGTGGNGKAKKPEKSLQQQVAELNAIVKIERDISNARLAGDEVLQAQLEAYKRQLEIKHQGLAPELEALELERNGIQLNETLAKLEEERLAHLAKFLEGTTEQIQNQTEIIRNYQEETRMLELQAVKGQEFVDKLKQIKTLVEEGGMSFAQAFDEVNRRAAALKEKVDPMKDVFEQMASTAATTFSSAFDAAVDGTENLGMALQNLGLDLLKTISKMLMMYAIAQALGALGGDDKVGVFSYLAKAFGFKGKAKGGPVTGGTPYIVGERGPELFVPKGSGTIVPNDRLGGGDNVSVVVNVDAKGTSVQGNDQEGNQLGRVISAAVKAELIKQKRPGGLLA